MSKSYRLLEIAREVFAAAPGVAIEVLDLSRLASEYGRRIHPCKACFSTAAALCHWPCSCYPNHSLGQTQDWMNEIYPMWVAAHGVMIITPVNWYQVSSPLKLMMDRLVCADGGNPDPTRTQGKNAELAKRIELEGWDYPRHLEGSRSSCTGTSREPRTSGGAFPTGFASWTSVPPGRPRNSTAISDIGSLMPPATLTSMPILQFKTRCAMPLARCSTRSGANLKASW
jgi:multimeric flavodoxin WrbA